MENDDPFKKFTVPTTILSSLDSPFDVKLHDAYALFHTNSIMVSRPETMLKSALARCHIQCNINGKLVDLGTLLDPDMENIRAHAKTTLMLSPKTNIIPLVDDSTDCLQLCSQLEKYIYPLFPDHTTDENFQVIFARPVIRPIRIWITDKTGYICRHHFPVGGPAHQATVLLTCGSPYDSSVVYHTDIQSYITDPSHGKQVTCVV